jgi:AraC-like DNA-binding protein
MSPSRSTLNWWANSRLQPVWIYRRGFAEEENGGANPAAPFRLWHLESGRAEVKYSSHRWTITNGGWIALPAGFGSQYIGKGSQLVSVALDWQDAEGTHPFDDYPPLPFTGSSQWAELFNALLRWTRQHGRAEYSQWLLGTSVISPQAYGELQAMLWSLLAEVLSLYERAGYQSPLAGPHDSRLREVMKSLRTHARAPFPDKKVLEGQCGLSWRRIEQLCAKQLHITPGAYHARLRLREAQQLLLGGELQIKQVAFELGFPNASIFCQWFKQHTGSTPAQFARNARF